MFYKMLKHCRFVMTCSLTAYLIKWLIVYGSSAYQITAFALVLLLVFYEQKSKRRSQVDCNGSFQVQLKDKINMLKTSIFNVESRESSVESTQQASSIFDGSGNFQ